MTRKPSEHSLDLRHWLLVAMAIVCGVVLRVVYLDKAPPGLHFDEAVYGLMARDIGPGYWPLFFTAYTGREPMYMYLMAGVFRLLGVSAVTLRLTSAFVGIATIPLAYWLARALYGKRVALLTAWLTTLSYWHLSVSRNGYPNVLIPPLECIAVLALWSGYRQRRPLLMLLGGGATGAVLYTYLAARLFPPTLLLFFLYVWLIEGRAFLQRLPWLILAAGTAILVFAPLGLFFIRHPEHFWERANQVLVLKQAHGGQAIQLILRNLGQTLAGFVWRGDPRWKFNLSGRPIFTLPLSLCFLGGTLIACRRIRRPQYGLLLIWTLGMCTPAILTQSAMPQSQRMFGVIPAIFMLAALGLDWIWERAQERWGTKGGTLAATLIAMLLTVEGGRVAYAYFERWAGDPKNYDRFHKPYELLAQRAVDEMDAGHQVVILSEHYRHPTALFVAPRSGEALWVVGPRAIAIPQRPGQEIIYLWPLRRSPLNQVVRERFLEITEPIGDLLDPWDKPAVQVRRLLPEVLTAEGQAEEVARFGDELALLDWDLPARARRDKPLRLLIHWRALRHVDAERYLSVHLVDSNGIRWSQHTDLGYLTDQWQPGDTVYQQFEIPLPPGIAPGAYEVRFLYAREGARPLPASRVGRPQGIYVPLGTVHLKPKGAFVEPIPEEALSLGALRIREHDPLDTTLPPGMPATVHITWQAPGKLSEDIHIRLSLFDGQGQEVWHVVQRPVLDYATGDWQPGEVVRAAYSIPTARLPNGRYNLEVKVEDSGEGLSLGTLTIEGGPFLTTLPESATPVEVRFGTEIALLGYEMNPKRPLPGKLLELTLYWQALTAPQSNYKVFVHLVDANEHILAQSDAVPAGWQRPTTGWAPGEIIADVHTLPVPEINGDYKLYVGLYEEQTLRRLPVHGAQDIALPDGRFRLLPQSAIR